MCKGNVELNPDVGKSFESVIESPAPQLNKTPLMTSRFPRYLVFNVHTQHGNLRHVTRTRDTARLTACGPTLTCEI